ncbi:MAG: metalloregulator ArsR/SmtB family transcription factor [Candidatus Diapherotrites archaeon]|nr:metalloregulator ArsR/SmtB family transcription factor [Candidatus Diapherotrites archaeon]
MKTVSIPYHLCLETLGNELRIKIIESLREKPLTVGQLANALKVEQSRLSHSLAALKQCNFVESKVKGKERVYQLTESFVKEMPESKDIFDALEKHFKKFKCKCRRKEK